MTTFRLRYGRHTGNSERADFRTRAAAGDLASQIGIFQMRRTLTLLIGCGFAMVGSSAAPAGQADAGRAIALQSCTGCHAISARDRNEMGDAPPFDVIARSHNYDAASLAFALLGPHPKMNFAPTQREVDDLAAFISGLK